MITAFSILLIAIWAISVAKSQTAGGLTHALLVAGAALLAVQVVRFFRKRKRDKQVATARLKRKQGILHKAMR